MLRSRYFDDRCVNYGEVKQREWFNYNEVEMNMQRLDFHFPVSINTCKMFLVSINTCNMK